jgi:Co/Zn/Cd efflux system component
MTVGDPERAHAAHRSKDTGMAYAVGVSLNLAFVGIEAALGVSAHSTALLVFRDRRDQNTRGAFLHYS